MTSGTKPAEYYRDQYGIHPVFTITQDLLYAPVSGEPSGGTWHKVSNPATGNISSKTSGWTSDSFTGGLTVNFSSVVPTGTKAVRITVTMNAAQCTGTYYRKGSDANISNTPMASGEVSHCLFVAPVAGWMLCQVVVWLSSTYTADFSVDYDTADLYISYPVEYLI
jgi:hypothetical protein